MHIILHSRFKALMPDIVTHKPAILVRDQVQQSTQSARYSGNQQHAFHSKTVDAYSKSY